MSNSHNPTREITANPNDDSGECEALSYLVTRFATKEIAPHVQAWDQAGEFPRDLYIRAAQLGLLGLGYPEDLGGTPASYRMRHAMALPLARFGASGGVLAGLFSHNIGLPPVLRHGSTELQHLVAPPCCAAKRLPRWPLPSRVVGRM